MLCARVLVLFGTAWCALLGACGSGTALEPDAAAEPADGGAIDAASELEDAAADSCVLGERYRDDDGDGFGTGDAILACPGPGLATLGGDCDDTDPNVRPDAIEACDTRDDDCDGFFDEGACPVGCSAASFGGHAYALCIDARSRAAAASRCASLGMRLARVDDAAENAWLRTTATAAALDRVWIGGSDAAAEGEWRWADGEAFWMGLADGTPVGGLYTRWRAGEPNETDPGEDCMEIWSDGLWNDQACGAARASICEAY